LIRLYCRKNCHFHLSALSSIRCLPKTPSLSCTRQHSPSWKEHIVRSFVHSFVRSFFVICNKRAGKFLQNGIVFVVVSIKPTPKTTIDLFPYSCRILRSATNRHKSTNYRKSYLVVSSILSSLAARPLHFHSFLHPLGPYYN